VDVRRRRRRKKKEREREEKKKEGEEKKEEVGCFTFPIIFGLSENKEEVGRKKSL